MIVTSGAVITFLVQSFDIVLTTFEQASIEITNIQHGLVRLDQSWTKVNLSRSNSVFE